MKTYIINEIGTNLYRIGESLYPNQLIKELQSYNPFKLKIACIMNQFDDIKLLRKIRKNRIIGEWFQDYDNENNYSLTYFFNIFGTNIYKIGQTDSVFFRFTHFQAYIPHFLKIIYLTNEYEEIYCLTRFQKYLIKGEWFQDNDNEIIKFIKENINETTKQLINEIYISEDYINYKKHTTLIPNIELHTPFLDSI